MSLLGEKSWYRIGKSVVPFTGWKIFPHIVAPEAEDEDLEELVTQLGGAGVVIFGIHSGCGMIFSKDGLLEPVKGMVSEYRWDWKSESVKQALLIGPPRSVGLICPLYAAAQRREGDEDDGAAEAFAYALTQEEEQDEEHLVEGFEPHGAWLPPDVRAAAEELKAEGNEAFRAGRADLGGIKYEQARVLLESGGRRWSELEAGVRERLDGLAALPGQGRPPEKDAGRKEDYRASALLVPVLLNQSACYLLAHEEDQQRSAAASARSGAAAAEGDATTGAGVQEGTLVPVRDNLVAAFRAANEALRITGGQAAKAWFRRACAFERMRDPRNALRDLEEALLRAPGDKAIARTKRDDVREAAASVAESMYYARHTELDDAQELRLGLNARRALLLRGSYGADSYQDQRAQFAVAQPLARCVEGTLEEVDGRHRLLLPTPPGPLPDAPYLHTHALWTWEFLVQRAPNLQLLQVEDVDLGSGPLEWLCKCLRSHPEIKTLRLRGAHVGPAGAKMVRNVLAQNTSLVEVTLDACGLLDAGLHELAEGLATASGPLEVLSLRGNSFTAKRLSKLAEALCSADSGCGLRELDLSENPLGIAGAKEMAQIMREASGQLLAAHGLHKIALQDCALDFAAFWRLVGSLDDALPLSSLDLRCNPIGRGTRRCWHGTMGPTIRCEVLLSDHPLKAKRARQREGTEDDTSWLAAHMPGHLPSSEQLETEFLFCDELGTFAKEDSLPGLAREWRRRHFGRPGTKLVPPAPEAHQLRLHFLYSSPLSWLRAGQPAVEVGQLDVHSEVLALRSVQGLSVEVCVATSEALLGTLVSCLEGSVLHLSAHCCHCASAREPAAVLLEDQCSRAHVMGEDELVRMKRWDRLGLLVFLSCGSEVLVRKLVQQCGLRHALCCSGEVFDSSARLFCRVFYQALAAGRTVAESHDSAVAAVKQSPPDLGIATEAGKFLLIGDGDIVGQRGAPFRDAPWPRWSRVDNYVCHLGDTHTLAHVLQGRRAAVLWGEPGIGKTALCREFCRHFSAPGGRLFSAGALLASLGDEPAEPPGRHAAGRDLPEALAAAALADAEGRGCCPVAASPRPRTWDELLALSRRFDERGAPWLLAVDGLTLPPRGGPAGQELARALGSLLVASPGVRLLIACREQPGEGWAELGGHKVVLHQKQRMTEHSTFLLFKDRLRRKLHLRDFEALAGAEAQEELASPWTLLDRLRASPVLAATGGVPGRVVRAAEEVSDDLHSMLQHPLLVGRPRQPLGPVAAAPGTLGGRRERLQHSDAGTGGTSARPGHVERQLLERPDGYCTEGGEAARALGIDDKHQQAIASDFATAFADPLTRVVIALQEMQGTLEDPTLLANSTEHSYLAYHSQVQINRECSLDPSALSTSASGIGFLGPFGKAERTCPPEERPIRLVEVVFPGRAAWLRVAGTSGQTDVNILNVRNHDLSFRDRVGIVAHWRQRRARAAERPQGRLLVLLGDFNVAEHPPESLDAPVDADAAPAYFSISFENILGDIDTADLNATTKRRATKNAATEAAKQTRDTITKIATSELNGATVSVSKAARALSLRSISSSIWHQDARFADALIKSAWVAAQQMLSMNSQVPLEDPAACQAETDAAHSAVIEERKPQWRAARVAIDIWGHLYAELPASIVLQRLRGTLNSTSFVDSEGSIFKKTARAVNSIAAVFNDTFDAAYHAALASEVFAHAARLRDLPVLMRLILTHVYLLAFLLGALEQFIQSLLQGLVTEAMAMLTGITLVVLESLFTLVVIVTELTTDLSDGARRRQAATLQSLARDSGAAFESRQVRGALGQTVGLVGNSSGGEYEVQVNPRNDAGLMVLGLLAIDKCERAPSSPPGSTNFVP
ncbi:unnamed protein product [Prorocentrum cordatum]|uniref:CHAT domain-containing protein n=1 Tax=Prorocentrum cordatum TaxID=2364126 RepID=A0ABN9XYD0_9DINO|nr:unnamed protein product [Polarella glacialis]